MKLNKNQLSVVKYIIKEEIEKFQKKTLLESEKKKLMKEFEMLKGVNESKSTDKYVGKYKNMSKIHKYL